MTSETTTPELIDLIKIQCPFGFDLFYRKYSSWLYDICLYAVKCNKITEEIVAEVFVKVYSKIQIYDTNQLQFHSWLLNILGCTVREYYQSRNMKHCFKVEKFPYFSCHPKPL